jgi:hypothetical protein
LLGFVNVTATLVLNLLLAAFFALPGHISSPETRT